MPSLFTKWRHRKSGSGSSTPTSPTSPSRDRRTSMPPTNGQGLTGGSQTASARKSMDSPRREQRERSSPPQSPTSHNIRAADVTVNPARPAPPPPQDQTAVMDHNTSAPETTVPFASDHERQHNDMSSSTGAGPDTDRPLPSLPSLPHILPSIPHLDSTSSARSHEIRDVEDRRSFPSVNSAGPRHSVEGEVGRQGEDRAGYLGFGSDEIERRRSTRDGKAFDSSRLAETPTRGSSLSRHDENDSDASVYSTQLEGEGGLSARLRGLTLNAKSGNLLPLEKQTEQLVEKVMAGAKERRARRGELSEFGRQTWEQASMRDLIGKEDTVDVETKWLPPVVQEIIIPRVHTEYLTVIQRDIHKHHVYPKIQPIEDPDPIVLPTRHRIFSATTGKWHEVVGDEAAIEILGRDVFENGPKEHRLVRRIATDTGTLYGNLLDEATLRGEAASDNARGLGRIENFIDGLTEEELLAQGFGTGGRGKIVEREWVRGAERKPDWKKAVRGRIFGRFEEEEGVRERYADGEVGTAV